MKKEEGYNISESGNWNVASDYSKLKIMKLLYHADEYANIATFGTATLAEELQNPLPPDILRLKGFERLINCLIMLIDNTFFAVRKGDLENMKKFRKDLIRIKGIKHTLSTVIFNQRKGTRSIKVEEEKYVKVLDLVLDIKSKINEPLNKADLIYTSKEEFDPIKYKKEIFDLATTRG